MYKTQAQSDMLTPSLLARAWTPSPARSVVALSLREIRRARSQRARLRSGLAPQRPQGRIGVRLAGADSSFAYFASGNGALTVTPKTSATARSFVSDGELTILSFFVPGSR